MLGPKFISDNTISAPLPPQTPHSRPRCRSRVFGAAVWWRAPSHHPRSLAVSNSAESSSAAIRGEPALGSCAMHGADGRA